MLEGTTWDPEGEPTRAGSAARPVVSPILSLSSLDNETGVTNAGGTTCFRSRRPRVRFPPPTRRSSAAELRDTFLQILSPDFFTKPEGDMTQSAQLTRERL